MSEILYSQTVAAQMLGISRGTLVKRICKGEIREYQKKPSKLVRSKANQIADGIAIEVSGKTPAEVGRIVTNRIQEYLKDMNEVPWHEFERI